MTRKLDLRVTNHGTIATVEAQNLNARTWLEEHTETEGWQWLGPWTLAVEPRYVTDLLVGAQNDGLEVGE